MNYTSAEAAKLLRKLNEEKDALADMEQQSCYFFASLGEDVESVRPEYDYHAVQEQLAAIEAKIRKVKHIINLFNVNHTVPGFDMTIDQMLVYIPQLSQQKQKLYRMKNRLPKQRQALGGSTAVIDYNYANYDIAKAKEDYQRISDELSKAQTALDVINSTETMEIDL
ncbi:MAG: hypothetical protein Q4F21_04950 [Lachnospiraceae bacterium]|nr:hypothetical protein [Lachnospiraceae bacterium]